MSNHLFSSLLFFLFSASLVAQSDLTVTVNGIEAVGEGKIIVLLFDNKDDFGPKPEGAAYRGEVTDFGSKARHIFTGLPSGTYAVMTFQDLNENGTIDKNFIGFPKEPLAAYNMKKMSRPTFTKSSLTLGDQPLSIDLKLLNQ